MIRFKFGTNVVDGTHHSGHLLFHLVHLFLQLLVLSHYLLLGLQVRLFRLDAIALAKSIAATVEEN